MMVDLALIVLNYRTPQLVADCLYSFAQQIVAGRDCVVVVDNGSGDDSAEIIQALIDKEKWQWATVVTAPGNNGFSAGNNFGMQAVDAAAYFLVNSDTLARPNVLATLHTAFAERPRAGLISPRLEWPDETPQISCFRYHSPTSEFLEAAKTGPISKLLPNYSVAIPIQDRPIYPEWTSFASVVVRQAVIDEVGWMDEGYFMYFEDVDYCRRVRAAGWDIVHLPDARMVHLRGGTSDVKAATIAGKRRPAYFYRARSRYFAKFYGGSVGLWRANISWLFGRTIALLRETIGNKQPHTVDNEARDIWTNWKDPLSNNE